MSEAARKFFNTEILLKMLDGHKNGKKVNEKTDDSRKIWSVYIFLVWYDRFFGHEKPVHPARLSAVLMICASGLLRMDAGNA